MKASLFFLFSVIAVTACARSGSVPAPVQNFEDVSGTAWKLAALEPALPDRPAFNRADLTDAGAFTLSFDAAEGRIAGKGFPNRYFGPYETAGGTITIRGIAGTLMAAFNEPESLKEREYYNLLEAVRSWELIDGRLILRSQKEGTDPVTLTFEAE
jgi:heat shock protein HslJ